MALADLMRLWLPALEKQPSKRANHEHGDKGDDDELHAGAKLRFILSCRCADHGAKLTLIGRAVVGAVVC